MIAPTIEAVRAQIPPDALAYARGLGEDWCHPAELRRLRELADQTVPKIVPEMDLKGHQTITQLDWTIRDGGLDIWVSWTCPWPRLRQVLSHATAEDYLVYLVAYNLDRNWANFEAPKIALFRETHLEDT